MNEINRNDLEKKVPKDCPICLSKDQITLRFKKNDYRIYQCCDCRGLFVHPQPEEKDLLDIYSKEYFQRGNKYKPVGANPCRDPNYHNDLAKLNLIKKHKTSGRLLDVGCAMGGFLKVARDQGFDVNGVEVSQYATEYVKNNLGIEVSNCPLPSAGLSEESFDVITLWDVIEHLSDPHPTLAAANKLLRRDGILLLSTGDVSSLLARIMGSHWHLLTPPQHLFFYMPQSMEKVLKPHRFVLKEILYLSKYASLDFILFKAQESWGSAFGYIRAFCQKTRMDRIQLHVNLRDIMTCVIRKA